jgi:malonyl CoA-acyl carrier protein transacylase/acyl carrier protein
LAFKRAFEASDRDPSELSYYEAHGTGTPVGDRSEIAALTGFLRASGVTKQRCAVGSVKALIGHTKASAGLAGLIKAVLALRHGTLPGQPSVRQPHPELVGDGPVYLPATSSPWPAVPGTRLAAVSAFGFGGTNFAVLLSDRHRRAGQILASAPTPAPLPSELSVIALPLPGRDPLAALRKHREHLNQWLLQMAGVNRPLNTKIVEWPWLPSYSTAWPSAAFLALDRCGDNGLQQLDVLERRMCGHDVEGLVHISALDDRVSPPPVVLMFPGQGSVYPGMGSAWMLSSSRVREALALLQSAHPDPDLIVRVLGGSRANADRHAFWSPSVMQVVLMLHQLAAFDWLDQLGLRPNAVIGHSIGDYLALHAAGALPLESLVPLVVERALCIERCIADLDSDASGGMIVVKAELTDFEQRLTAFPELTLANRNSPIQGVVAGPLKQLSAFQAQLLGEGLDVIRLDLPVAYHHPCLHPAATEFNTVLDQVEFRRPLEQCLVSLSTDPLSPLKDPDQIRQGLRDHLCGQVDFVATVARTETLFPGAVYVDVGPRQTGCRLLQANGVGSDRTLRMDDRDDAASQPVRVAFALLQKGYVLDEAVLMRVASHPRTTVWKRGSSGRLPYLINGYAAVPLDGKPMPSSPLVPVISTKVEKINKERMADPASDRLLEVYAEYQKTMRMFLESQDQVFAALTSGDLPVPPTSPSPGIAQTSGVSRMQTHIAPVVSSSEAPAGPASVVPSISFQAESSVAPPISVEPPIELSQKSSSGSPFDSEQTMRSFITDVLVDRTGYPPELLEPEAHLESDLGIDSIKQVEVLGALIEAMPTALSSEQMPEIRAAAREMQTIAALSRFMLDLNAGKA